MKNEPQRMCLVCRQMKDKRSLMRIVKSGESIRFDATFKAAGRGAYVCRDRNCLDKLIQKKLLNKAFGCNVPQSVYDEVSEALDE